MPDQAPGHLYIFQAVSLPSLSGHDSSVRGSLLLHAWLGLLPRREVGLLVRLGVGPTQPLRLFCPLRALWHSLGCSGRGPWALACAHTILAITLSAVGLLGSTCPWDFDIPDGQRWHHHTCYLCRHGPSATVRLWNWLGGVMSRYAASGKDEMYFDSLTVRAVETADGKQVQRAASAKTLAEVAAIVWERLLCVCVGRDTHALIRDAYLLSNP